MNKIRVIDLLNKIANGEEVHFKTKLNGKEVAINYYNDRDFSTSTGLGLLTIADIIKSLNDEVEILEEKKIPEKLKLYILSDNDSADFTTLQDFNNRDIQRTINWILDYLKSKGE